MNILPIMNIIILWSISFMNVDTFIKSINKTLINNKLSKLIKKVI